MNIQNLLQLFVENILYVLCGVILGYLGLIATYYRFDCWKEDVWKSVYNLLCIPVDRTKLYVYQSNSGDHTRIIPIDDRNTMATYATARSSARLFVIGTKHILLFRPTVAIIWKFLFAVVFIAMIVSLPAAWNSQYQATTFNTSVIIGTVMVALSGLQWILLNSLKGGINKLEEDIDTPIDSFIYASRAIKVVPDHRNIVCESDYFKSILETNAASAQLQNTETLYLFVSVKSKLFTSEFFKYVFKEHFQHFPAIAIVLVDKPYVENLKKDYDGKKLDEKINILEKVKQEKISCIENAKKELDEGCIRELEYKIIPWTEMEMQVDEKIRQEVKQALQEEEGVFRKDALVEVSKIVKRPYEELQHYLGFLAVELPVLFQTYYGGESVVDIYPASNTPLIWNLERGIYVDDLPYVTKLASIKPLKYIKVESIV